MDPEIFSAIATTTSTSTRRNLAHAGGLQSSMSSNNTLVVRSTKQELAPKLDFDEQLRLAASSLNPTVTSVLLIVILHLLFLYQWSGRKRRNEVLVSYRVLVAKRQYHKVWLAILSHPPAQNHHHPLGHPESPAMIGFIGGETGRSGSFRNSNNNENNHPQQQHDIRSRITAKAREFGSWAYESGFALMLFNSHILWSCRSLEAYYNFNLSQSHHGTNSSESETINVGSELPAPAQNFSFQVHPLQYVRVMFALTGIALLMELRFSHLLLKISKRLSGSDSPASQGPTDLNNSITLPTNGGERRSSNHNRIQKKILQRPIGTLTALTSGLVYVFRQHFEYIPLQVFPFIDNRWLLLGFKLPPPLTSFLCWFILAYLSYPSHPITSVVCGFLSGFLWGLGFTSFLQEPYWGNSIVIGYLLMCCMSIRASGYSERERNERNSSPPTWIPCIDFVSWNRRGEAIRSSSVTGAVDQDPQPSSDNSLSTNDDDSSSGDGSASFNSSDHDGLYGRIPQFGESFDDNDDANNNHNDIEMAPLLENERNQTVRSRRSFPV